MIPTIINLILSILYPTTAGYVCLQLLTKKRSLSLWLKIPLSFGLGLGILAFWMLYLYISQQPFHLLSIRTPLIVIIIFGLLVDFNWRNPHQSTVRNSSIQTKNLFLENRWAKSTRFFFIAILLLYIAHNTYFVIWRSMTMPIYTWDAIATIALKSKLFYFERSHPPLKLLPHPSYPLLVPFVQCWIALNLGHWHDIFIKIIFPCAYLSYLAVQYYFLSRITNRTWAIMGSSLLLSSNFFIYHATISYRDFILMYYNCTTIILLLLWISKKNDYLLTIAGLFAGIMTFTKLEGTGYLLIQTILLMMILLKNNTYTSKNKIIKFFKFILPSYVLCLFYHIYKIHINLSSMADRTTLTISPEHLARIPMIIHDFYWNLFFSGNWSLIWFLLLISAACHRKKIIQINETKFLCFALLMYFSIYLIILTLTSALIDNPTTLSRIILHFYPLSVLLIILLNYPHAQQRE